MTLAINSHRLQELLTRPFPIPSPNELRRQGRVFFIGGNLPVLETLETMYESYCQESSGLFHVTLADGDKMNNSLELVRQIKKNFSVRLMGRASHPLPDMLYEQLYLAGLDILDIPQHILQEEIRAAGLDPLKRLAHASAAFPGWSLISSFQARQMAAPDLRDTIHSLLGNGIVPLLTLSSETTLGEQHEMIALFTYLADKWQEHEVPLKPLLPLIELVTPLFSKSGGFLRNTIDRFHDRRMLATSDLRRHLRTSGAEASFESAGL